VGQQLERKYCMNLVKSLYKLKEKSL